MRNYNSTFKLVFTYMLTAKVLHGLNEIHKHSSFMHSPSYNRSQQTWLRILPDWSPISCTRSKIWKFQLFIFSMRESWSNNVVSNVGFCSTYTRVRYSIISKITTKSNLPVVVSKEKRAMKSNKLFLDFLNGAVTMVRRKSYISSTNSTVKSLTSHLLGLKNAGLSETTLNFPSHFLLNMTSRQQKARTCTS